MSPNSARARGDSSRQRRAHLKSRNGCARCKRLRKKCDEKQPRCTRCRKQGVHCDYGTAADGVDEAGSSSVSERHSRQATGVPDSAMRDSVSTDPHSAHTPTSSHPHARSADAAFPAVGTRPMLNARELALFSHYITHTSHVIPYGREDMFPLQVGMPNLALTDAAVMDAILALAASCECHDTLHSGGDATSPATLDEVGDLLRLADRHHQTSLGRLQHDVQARRFQSVLPNAALMVLYALSSHHARVLLARRARRLGVALARDVLPFPSQWITSIRAAHGAFVGLLRPGFASPRARVREEEEEEEEEQEAEERLAAAPLGAAGDGTCRFQDGPAEETRRLLLPIITSTYGAALERLRARSDAGNLAASTAKSDACGSALAILQELFYAVLGGHDHYPRPPPRPPPDLCALDNAPPWLVRYLARVTSATPSKLWRRRIMAFLNQVPFEFLQLVQRALDCMPVDDDGLPRPRPPLEAAHKPAMDIFAHWLVLVMLLDGVWWIGDVGHWELRRIVRFVAAQGFVVALVEGETWWPETMYAIKSTLGTAA